MNLKVPGATLPLGCAILSTRARTVRGVGTTRLRRTRVNNVKSVSKNNIFLNYHDYCFFFLLTCPRALGLHRKTQVNHLTHMSHSGSVHGQKTQKCVKNESFCPCSDTLWLTVSQMIHSGLSV